MLEASFGEMKELAGKNGEKLLFCIIRRKKTKYIEIKYEGRICMNPSFKTEGACLTIQLPKELDHPASDLIRRESDRIMDKTYIKTIVFDFGNTGFMDSSGIGLIMGRYRALGMRGDCIRAVHVNGHIDKLLRLSGVCRYMEIQKQEAACENIEE